MITPLQARENTQNEKLAKASRRMEALIDALNQKEIPPVLATAINQDIQSINQSANTEETLVKGLEDTRNKILKLVEKEAGYVPRNHYRKLWLALGLASFGITIGLIFSLLVGNMGYLGIGFPFGLAIGAGVGTKLDKKAEAEGKTLEVD